MKGLTVQIEAQLGPWGLKEGVLPRSWIFSNTGRLRCTQLSVDVWCWVVSMCLWRELPGQFKRKEETHILRNTLWSFCRIHEFVCAVKGWGWGVGGQTLFILVTSGQRCRVIPWCVFTQPQWAGLWLQHWPHNMSKRSLLLQMTSTCRRHAGNNERDLRSRDRSRRRNKAGAPQREGEVRLNLDCKPATRLISSEPSPQQAAIFLWAQM